MYFDLDGLNNCRFADIPLVLAGEHPVEEVRTGVHGRAHAARAHFEHTQLDIQDQQEGSIFIANLRVIYNNDA